MNVLDITAVILIQAFICPQQFIWKETSKNSFCQQLFFFPYMSRWAAQFCLMPYVLYYRLLSSHDFAWTWSGLVCTRQLYSFKTYRRVHLAAPFPCTAAPDSRSLYRIRTFGFRPRGHFYDPSGKQAIACRSQLLFIANIHNLKDICSRAITDGRME